MRRVSNALLLLVVVVVDVSAIFNSGCLSGNKEVDNACQRTGCSQLPDPDHWDSTLLLSDGSGGVPTSYFCSRDVICSDHQANMYNFVASSVEGSFSMINSSTNDPSIYESPKIYADKANNYLELEIQKLSKLKGTDSFEILINGNTTYCGFYVSDLLNSPLYSQDDDSYVGKYSADPNAEYYVTRAYANFQCYSGDYPECPTFDRVESTDMKRTRVNANQQIDALRKYTFAPRKDYDHGNTVVRIQQTGKNYNP